MRRGVDIESTVLAGSKDPGVSSHRPVKNTRIRPALFSILATTGIFGGISALFIGLIFVVVHDVLPADIIFNQIGTGLLIAAIPMILLGSICIDEIEGKK